MTKLGKIVLSILVLGGIFIFSAAAQDDWTAEWTRESLQDIYMEHLITEGFRPEIDDDGDIQFKVLGSNYFIIIDDVDLNFFQLYTGFWLDDMTMEEAYDMVNYANRRSKVAKISLSASEDEPDRLIVSITAELLVDHPEDFVFVFNRAISLLANAKSIFQGQLAKL